MPKADRRFRHDAAAIWLGILLVGGVGLPNLAGAEQPSAVANGADAALLPAQTLMRRLTETLPSDAPAAAAPAAPAKAAASKASAPTGQTATARLAPKAPVPSPPAPRAWRDVTLAAALPHYDVKLHSSEPPPALDSVQTAQLAPGLADESPSRALKKRSVVVDAPLRLMLGTAQGQDGTFKLNDALVITVIPSADAHVYCYYEDGAHQVAQIFPNRFQPDSLVAASKGVRIPTTGAGFDIILDRPGKDEQVACLATPAAKKPALPAKLESTGLTPIGFSSIEEVVATFRAVDEGNVAEARLHLTVLEAPAASAEVAKAARPARTRSAEPPLAMVEAPTQVMTLAAGTGQLIRLEQSVSNIMVADPNVADVKAVSPRLLYVFGNQTGRTNVFCITKKEKVVASIDLTVVPDAQAAQAQLQSLRPDSQATLGYAGDRVVANGVVRDPGEAVELAALTKQLAANRAQPALNNTVIPGSQQVNIRVRFAEVSRSDLQRLGINLQSLINTGDFLFGIASGSAFLPGGVPGLPGIGDFNAAETAGTIFGSGEFGDFNIDLLLDALQRENVVSILAEPNLTAINGETATFLAGGEVPIPVPQDRDTITIEYKPFGVSLDFVPTLLPGDRINLRVRPEVSDLLTNGGIRIDDFEIPAFLVRRAETTVELASGQTFAIAGLFSRNLTTDLDKFPGLAEVPVLGQLFKSRRYQRKETELVILITPVLVRPTSQHNLALPNERLSPGTPPSGRGSGAGFIVN